MKFSIQHLIYLLGTIIILTSCSIEKRLYLSGFHIDWKKSEQTSQEMKIVNVDNQNRKENELGNEIGIHKLENVPSFSADTCKRELDNLLASQQPISFSNKIKTLVPSGVFNKTLEVTKIIVTQKPEEDKPHINTMALIGFILSLAIILMFPVNAILGIIFCRIGLREIKESPETQKGKGLAIAGLIISIFEILATVTVMTLWILGGGFNGLFNGLM